MAAAATRVKWLFIRCSFRNTAFPIWVVTRQRCSGTASLLGAAKGEPSGRSTAVNLGDFSSFCNGSDGPAGRPRRGGRRRRGDAQKKNGRDLLTPVRSV